MKVIPSALVRVCLFAACGSISHAALITFEPAAVPGTQASIIEWTEQNLRFITPNGVTSNGSSAALYPSNGTAYLQLLSTQTPLTIATLDASPFSLQSIDLAEYSTGLPFAVSVTFIGNLVGGGTVSTTFVTDGIIDGSGPLADFQTFSFPSSFLNLTSVTTTSNTFSFDNLQSVNVPEPGSAVLIAAGSFLCCVRRRGGGGRRFQQGKCAH